MLAMVIVLTGCSAPQTLLTVEALSTTKSALLPNEILVERGSIQGKYCAESFEEAGFSQLLQEAVGAAQRQHHLDFILKANIQVSGTCLLLSGMGASVSSSARVPLQNFRSRKSQK